ncbi:MAG: aminotransferase class I/II-fold pyridoxal phosphate-dependent enzyme [Candidatus Pseudobacter hemicellulosilyticus]|uniref:Aminotransferase class I/II-fold pyridoxal phosphate-dependent enzyme n=1 Tax=Candidatus Pseudobacter hemicellulosilyticus TaxID=3121375 RepID=A0AAJ5X1A8_9BACT|nr:MAG: aminotransferase class I/II-fold pyridoxal phosphate-dependent enzyme [Pseudobacter sp.]
MKLSKLAESIPGSPILAMSNSIKAMIAGGNPVDNFTVGDFNPAFFPIPATLEEAIIKAYQEHQTNYPAAEGNLDLRKAISQFAQSFQGHAYTENEVLVGAGGRPLIYALYRTIVDKGDKVVYPVPGWNNHFYASLTEAEHCTVETAADNFFMPTAADLAPHLEGATLLALCSPQNPTGTCFRKEDLLGICQLVVEENNRRGPDQKKLYVMFDQMYSLLLQGDNQHYHPVGLMPEMRPYTIYIDAISKAFAATGVRVGWALGPAAVLNKMKSILTHVGAWAPMAEQKATAWFLGQTELVNEYLQEIRRQIGERLFQLHDGILALKAKGFPVDAIKPQAALYLTMKIDIPQAHTLMLDEANMGILPFDTFGSPDGTPWYRISVGTCKLEAIPGVLERMEKALVSAMTAV